LSLDRESVSRRTAAVHEVGLSVGVHVNVSSYADRFEVRGGGGTAGCSRPVGARHSVPEVGLSPPVVCSIGGTSGRADFSSPRKVKVAVSPSPSVSTTTM
jgi:hypothetical protein